MADPRQIRLSKYLAHRAQLAITATGTFGADTYVSSTYTVSVLYYVGNVERDIGERQGGSTRRVENADLEHYCVLASTPVVKVGDQLLNVVTQDGDTLVTSARITKVEKFAGWQTRHGYMLQQVTVNFN